MNDFQVEWHHAGHRARSWAWSESAVLGANLCWAILATLKMDARKALATCLARPFLSGYRKLTPNALRQSIREDEETGTAESKEHRPVSKSALPKGPL
jgi:hypothetical protein